MFLTFNREQSVYNHKEIEKKWQDFWEKNHTFQTEDPSEFHLNNGENKGNIKPKYYCLDMFPYPSGAGLHVGHPKGYTANDIVARYKKTNGFNVLHPMGWDAFGLPAENYALKTGTHPKITTEKNIETFKKQIQSLGFSYDWEREINTTDPKYFQWTQWIFLKMFERGLAYEQDLPINYCPSCKTGLANEEVVDGRCERCDDEVEKKQIRQWVLAITKYADRLASDVDKLDWPKGIKDMQKNWIGKSEGCEFEMKKAQKNEVCILVNKTGLNCPAKTSLDSILFESFIKVKKKTHFLKQIEGTIINGEKKIQFHSGNILKHFQSKSTKEFHYRKNILGTVFYSINKINFSETNIGHFIFKNYVIKIVLGKQSNGNFFVKTYYIDDKLTKLYGEYQGTVQNTPSIRVYTTRIDTVFGVTYAVIAPDHKDVTNFITDEQRQICEDYITECKNKSDQDRTNESKEKTGVFTGSYVINPFNNKQIPLWIGDYVLGTYGTGTVMAVPAHDERDFEFAKKYGLEIYPVILVSGKDGRVSLEKAITTYGKLINSGDFSGLSSEEAKVKLVEYAEKKGFGKKKVNYKLRDWLFSRQRYWGEPIPLVHLNKDEVKKLPRITPEELEEMETKSKKIIHKKMRLVPLEELESGTPKGTSTTTSLKGIILNNITKVKRKKTKNFKLTEVFKEENIGKKTIRISGQYLKEHFKNKKGYDKIHRIKFAQTIIEYFDKVTFISENLGLININNSYYCIIIDLIDKKKNIYNLITFYHFHGLNKIQNNQAYVLKEEANETSDQRTLCSKGNVKSLVINGQIVSKIYSGLYSDIICDYKLPLALPEVENFEPAGDGNSPLAKVDNFVNITLADNLKGKRETNTMPQWGGSCWYHLRYMDPLNSGHIVDKKLSDYWGSIDSYVGGAEHAVLHLLYARFWHKFLFDTGVVSTDEPFQTLKNQGLILAYAYENSAGKLIASDLVEERTSPQPSPTGEGGVPRYFDTQTNEELKRVVAKMSKSLKNVVNPDDIVEEYGADSLRLYEMYIADFKDSAPWDTKNILGVRRFLEKSERLFTNDAKLSTEDDNTTMKLLHKTVKKVGEDIENYKFNTAIASLIILVNNGLPKNETLQSEWKQTFTKLLHPFAPHLAEELWERTGKKESIFLSDWPKYDEKMTIDETITIAIQVLGKLRGEIEVSKDEEKEIILKKAKENESIQKWIEGKEIIKEIYVPGKIVNFVVK